MRGMESERVGNESQKRRKSGRKQEMEKDKREIGKYVERKEWGRDSGDGGERKNGYGEDEKTG